MKPRIVKSLLAIAVLQLCLCAPATAQSPAEIGVLVADGDHAYVNGALIKEKKKYRILDGYTVTTGPDTSVRLSLTASGYEGYIQLDENTDPNLLVKSGCIAMEMLKGRAIINAKRICLKTPRLEGVTKSLVHLEVNEAVDELTVIKGSVDLQVPVATTVGAYWRYSVGSDGVAHTQQIDAAEARRTIEWQQQYFRGMPTWAKVLLGIVGANVLHEVIDDNDSPPSSPPPDTSPGSMDDAPEPYTPPPETPPVETPPVETPPEDDVIPGPAAG